MANSVRQEHTMAELNPLVKSFSLVSLTDVKETLEENRDLLSDQELLQDLFESINVSTKTVSSKPNTENIRLRTDDTLRSTDEPCMNNGSMLPLSQHDKVGHYQTPSKNIFTGEKCTKYTENMEQMQAIHEVSDKGIFSDEIFHTPTKFKKDMSSEFSIDSLQKRLSSTPMIKRKTVFDRNLTDKEKIIPLNLDVSLDLSDISVTSIYVPQKKDGIHLYTHVFSSYNEIISDHHAHEINVSVPLEQNDEISDNQCLVGDASIPKNKEFLCRLRLYRDLADASKHVTFSNDLLPSSAVSEYLDDDSKATQSGPSLENDVLKMKQLEGEKRLEGGLNVRLEEELDFLRQEVNRLMLREFWWMPDENWWRQEEDRWYRRDEQERCMREDNARLRSRINEKGNLSKANTWVAHTDAYEYEDKHRKYTEHEGYVNEAKEELREPRHNEVNTPEAVELALHHPDGKRVNEQRNGHLFQKEMKVSLQRNQSNFMDYPVLLQDTSQEPQRKYEENIKRDVKEYHKSVLATRKGRAEVECSLGQTLPVQTTHKSLLDDEISLLEAEISRLVADKHTLQQENKKLLEKNIDDEERRAAQKDMAYAREVVLKRRIDELQQELRDGRQLACALQQRLLATRNNDALQASVEARDRECCAFRVQLQEANAENRRLCDALFRHELPKIQQILDEEKEQRRIILQLQPVQQWQQQRLQHQQIGPTAVFPWAREQEQQEVVLQTSHFNSPQICSTTLPIPSHSHSCLLPASAPFASAPYGSAPFSSNPLPSSPFKFAPVASASLSSTQFASVPPDSYASDLTYSSSALTSTSVSTSASSSTSTSTALSTSTSISSSIFTSASSTSTSTALSTSTSTSSSTSTTSATTSDTSSTSTSSNECLSGNTGHQTVRQPLTKRTPLSVIESLNNNDVHVKTHRSGNCKENIPLNESKTLHSKHNIKNKIEASKCNKVIIHKETQLSAIDNLSFDDITTLLSTAHPFGNLKLTNNSMNQTHKVDNNQTEPLCNKTVESSTSKLISKQNISTNTDITDRIAVFGAQMPNHLDALALDHRLTESNERTVSTETQSYASTAPINPRPIANPDVEVHHLLRQLLQLGNKF